MPCLGEHALLSPATRRVLQLVAEGTGAGTIARWLGCDRDDVCRCLADAIRALSARSVPDAVEVAVRRGLIEEPAR
jgi:hypothetical protein